MTECLGPLIFKRVLAPQSKHIEGGGEQTWVEIAYYSITFYTVFTGIGMFFYSKGEKIMLNLNFS